MCESELLINGLLYERCSQQMIANLLVKKTAVYPRKHWMHWTESVSCCGSDQSPDNIV